MKEIVRLNNKSMIEVISNQSFKKIVIEDREYNFNNIPGATSAEAAIVLCDDLRKIIEQLSAQYFKG